MKRVMFSHCGILSSFLLCFLAAVSMCLSSCGPASAPAQPSAEPTAEKEPGQAEKAGYVEEYLASLPDSSAASVSEVEPDIPDELEKAIIGKDDRITISDTNAYPYSAIAYIEMTENSGAVHACTGYMAGSNKLLTAAHCIQDADTNRPFQYVNFYFGFRNYNNYYFRYTGPFKYWLGTTFPDGYTNEASEDDYAIVQFPENIVQYTGSFGLFALEDSAIENRYFYLAGYRDGIMKESAGLANVINEKAFSHKIDMLPGNSGCPIYDKYYYAIGVNVAESNYNQENYGRRIDQHIVDFIRELPDTY